MQQKHRTGQKPAGAFFKMTKILSQVGKYDKV
jgi:hypothetical protein